MQFQVATTRAKISDDLPAIKSATLLARATPQTVSMDASAFAAFQPYLENDWGPLAHGIPEHIHRRWMSSPGVPWDKQLPTNLLGDFGEFVSAHMFRAALKGSSRIARVVRPPGLKRPDFIILESKLGRLHALEAKASFPLAQRISAGTVKGRTYVNFCGDTRNRRQDGIPQVGHEALVLQRSATATTVTSAASHNYGVSRVVAHASHVAVPLFLEADMQKIGGPLSQPKACPTDCIKCLAHAGPLLLMGTFSNSWTEIRPLPPLPDRGVSVFTAYQAVGDAIWMRSTVAFERAFRELFVAIAGFNAEEDLGYALFLLDVVAAGIAAGVAETGFVDAVREIVEPDVLRGLAIFHAGEAEGVPAVSNINAWAEIWASMRPNNAAPASPSVLELREPGEVGAPFLSAILQSESRFEAHVGESRLVMERDVSDPRAFNIRGRAPTQEQAVELLAHLVPSSGYLLDPEEGVSGPFDYYRPVRVAVGEDTVDESLRFVRDSSLPVQASGLVGSDGHIMATVEVSDVRRVLRER